MICFLDVSVCLFKFLLQAKFLDFKIQNMVGSCDVKFPIRLEGLVLSHGQFSRYGATYVLSSKLPLYSQLSFMYVMNAVFNRFANSAVSCFVSFSELLKCLHYIAVSIYLMMCDIQTYSVCSIWKLCCTNCCS